VGKELSFSDYRRLRIPPRDVGSHRLNLRPFAKLARGKFSLIATFEPVEMLLLSGLRSTPNCSGRSLSLRLPIGKFPVGSLKDILSFSDSVSDVGEL